MANLFGVHDPDAERRTRAVGAAVGRMCVVDGLVNGQLSAGHLAVAWAVAPTTPVHEATARSGTRALVVGDVFADPESSSAHAVINAAEAGGPTAASGLNGLYLACVMQPDGGLTLATDVLGYFPLYYWTAGDVTLFATAPGLLSIHPDFQRKLSPHGLAGILLAGHMVNGQSIWAGVRRLEAGKALTFGPGHRVQEVDANPLVPSEACFGTTYEAAWRATNDELRAALCRATRRHQRVCLMLSGGLDSRLLAGHLQEIGADVHPVTFGDRRDIEMRCARAVARTLRWSHEPVSVRFDAFEAAALQQIRLESLSNTFVDFSWVVGRMRLRALSRPLVNGLIGNTSMGGEKTDLAYDGLRGRHSFDALFRRINSFGLPPHVIPQLLPGLIHPEVVEEVVAALRLRLDSLPGLPFQKSSLWALTNRMRFHVTPFAWRLSFGAWPIMPFADRRLLDLAAGLPLEYFKRRRLQVDAVTQSFPRLASLPLDRNTANPDPLVPTRGHQVRSRVMRFLNRGRRRSEHRYYYRTFDLNNPGWLAVRTLAERHRRDAERLMNADVLARLIPPPGRFIRVEDVLVDGPSVKTLLGLMILSGTEMA